MSYSVGQVSAFAGVKRWELGTRLPSPVWYPAIVLVYGLGEEQVRALPTIPAYAGNLSFLPIEQPVAQLLPLPQYQDAARKPVLPVTVAVNHGRTVAGRMPQPCPTPRLELGEPAVGGRSPTSLT